MVDTAKISGEEKAWATLTSLDPADVCRRALTAYSSSAGAYAVRVFNFIVTVAPEGRTISGSSPDCEVIIEKMAYFLRLSILHYLIGAQTAPLSGQLVRPSDTKVGQLYFKGSHVLPLSALSAAYARDTDKFLAQGIRFGGVRRRYGDTAVELYPFPRLPVTLILWREDDEFAARAELLFDDTCERHVPADILWSTAMLSVLLMMKG